MAHRTLVGLSILSRPPSLVCSYERLAARACALGSPPPSKLRYECAILPMVAGGNLLTVMAPAAQHTRSFLFAHNCDEETALFGERAWAALSALRGTCGKSEALRNNANYGGRCKCKRGERAAGCADSERAGHPNLTAKKPGFYAQTLQTDAAANPLPLPSFQARRGKRDSLKESALFPFFTGITACALWLCAQYMQREGEKRARD